MRRLPALLAPLLLLPLLAPLLGAGPAAAQTASSSPRPTTSVSLADDGRTITLRPGATLEVTLPAASGSVWQGLEKGAPTLHLVQYRSTEQEGLRARLDALSPGRYGGSAEVRPQTLTASQRFRCEGEEPPCATVGRAWSVQVVVEDGPVDGSTLACTAIARAMPSPLPGTVVVTEADDGRTVTVPRDGRLQVYLDGACGEEHWTPPQASGALFRASASLERPAGFVDALFTPTRAATSTVTSVLDDRCLHRTDSAGNGTCAVAQRAFQVTVQVGPSATPTACTRPTQQTFEVSPLRVVADDPVSAQGGTRDLCREPEQEPERDYQLLAQPKDGVEVVARQVRARSFSAELRPRVTTTYRLLEDGEQVGQPRTVVVDRVSGSCLGEVSLVGPDRAVAGTQAALGGSARPGDTVRILFKRYGQPGYTVRRTLPVDADGRFRTTFTVTDDHRWYAATDRCDSPTGLTQAAPRITGPAVVRRGETVTLRVEAVSGVRTTVFFRGAGEPFSARRTLTGPGTVTYTATRDQRYYALTRATISNHGLTQVR